MPEIRPPTKQGHIQLQTLASKFGYGSFKAASALDVRFALPIPAAVVKITILNWLNPEISKLPKLRRSDNTDTFVLLLVITISDVLLETLEVP